jgi:hypothetical protein
MLHNILPVRPKVRLHIPLCCCLLIALLAPTAFGQQPQVLLGDTKIESSTDQNPGGTAEAFPIQALATGSVNSISVYLDSSNVASTVWVGLYADSNGHPQALLAKGGISNPAPGHWNSVAMPALQVTAGTTYWLALLGVNGAVQFRDRNGRCQSEVDSQTSLSSLPAVWATGSRWPTCIVSMFETGTVSAGSVPPSGAAILISPGAIALQPGQQQQFSASVSGLSSGAVTWSATGGTITSSGLYTAPASAGRYTVTATSATSRRRSTAVVVTSTPAVVTVTLPNPPPVTNAVQVSVSPSAASMQLGAQQQFSARVSGTSNTAVTWSASSGTIVANGLYTAPGNAGTYTITAVSNSDQSKFSSALAVVSAPPTATVSISPANASISEANHLQFTAAVSGLSNAAVTWVVTRGSGKITQSGLYTAPGAAESDLITATSQADPTKSANASIAVIAPHSVALSWGASLSTVSYYKVYRGTVSGGPYSMLSSNVKATSYTDSTVQSGATYFYVTSSIDAAGVESIFSNELQLFVP